MSSPPAVSGFAPLREPNFRWFFASRVVNLVGGTMAPVALAFAVLEVSDSPSALGLVLAAHSIPMAVFMLAGGVIADRFDRGRVITVSSVVAGVSQLGFAALVLTGTRSLEPLVALTAVNGIAAALSFPAFASVMPQLVPREQLQAANVLTSMARNALAVVGPTVGGVLVVSVGAGWAVALDGATYLAAATLLLPLRLPALSRTSDAPTSMLAELVAGWGYFRRTTWLWAVVLAFGVVNAVQNGGYLTLGPVLAKASSIGESGWGLILSAEAVGWLVTSLVLLRVRLTRPLRSGMLGAAAFGLPALALGLDQNLLLVMAASFLAGAGIELFGLGWSVGMQEHVPEEMLSRAFSYDALGSFVAIPIGQLVAGPLAGAFGIEHVVTAAGVVVIGVCLVTLVSRSVRDLPRVVTSEPVSTTS